MNTSYAEFLAAKRHTTIKQGITPKDLPGAMFDFQTHVATLAIELGRCAVFLDTGLGKTLIELAIAREYVRETGKPVLILCPLAVAFQFVAEAAKFGIDGVSYSKDGTIESDIVLTNYERLHYFNARDFDCVILDESSILKNFEGATKADVTAFLRNVKYRFLFTATPAPNDYIELGTSSEALGHLGYVDMLGRYFKNNKNTVKASRVEMANAGADWYLRPHAERDFWRWVASWSVAMRKPSDAGFDDSRHVLPDLIEHSHVVRNSTPLVIGNQPSLFNFEAKSFAEIKAEVRNTINERCEKAAELVADKDHSVIWINLNDEGSRLRSLIPDAVELIGSMSIERKEEILVAFAEGQIKTLITKPTISGFGLNWQHCNHTVYFPTYSYEQYYQAIRRFWRFGQQRPVTVDWVVSDGQSRIVKALAVKREKAEQMFANMIANERTAQMEAQNEFANPVTKPTWL